MLNNTDIVLILFLLLCDCLVHTFRLYKISQYGFHVDVDFKLVIFVV